MKKIIAALLVGMMLTGATIASAEVNVKVIVNDEVIKEQSVIENSRTLAPLNATMTSAGAEVVWHGETRKIDVTKDGKTITLQIDSNVMNTPDGDKILDVAPKILSNNRTYLPIKAVCDEFGMTVLWDHDTKTVLVRSNDVCPYADKYYGITVQDYIASAGLTGEEFAEMLFLDYDEIKDMTISEAEYMRPIIETAKVSGFEDAAEGYVLLGVTMTKDMTVGEFEDELTLEMFFEYIGALKNFPDAATALEEFRQFYSLGEEYTLNTKYKFVRTIVENHDLSLDEK